MSDLWAQCTWVSLIDLTEKVKVGQVNLAQTWNGYYLLLLGIGFEVKVHGLSKFEETVAQAWNTMHYNGYFDLATGNYEWYPTYNFKGNTGAPL